VELTGTTSGALPRKAYLFRFRQIFPETVRAWYFTSYEADIIAAGQTYLSRPIEHGTWVDDLEIDKCKFTLRSRLFAGNPLALFVPLTLETPLLCDLYECSPDSANISGAPTLLASGRVMGVSAKGPFVQCEVASPFQNLSLGLPSLQIQPTCNYRLFSGPCGLLADSWKFTGSVVSVAGNQLTLGSLTFAGGALPSLIPGYFAFGRVWFGAGDAYASRSVYDSMQPAAGQVRLTLGSAFDVAPTGTVYFAPGCNRSRSHCIGKFNNYARFGGMPFVPPGNPTLISVKAAAPAGGKK
jgi:hypothetical protein